MKILLKLTVALLMLIALATAVSAEDKIRIVLDAGHGGHDPGTIVGTRYESEYNQSVADLLKEYLEETGAFEVTLTHANGEYKNYLHRSLVAEAADADLLISLHFNSSPEAPYKSGVEVLASVLDEWYPRTLASSIASSVSAECGLKNGGVIRKADTGDSRGVYYWHDSVGWDIPGVKSGRVSDYYSMLAWGTKLGYPALIVEHAYLSNASDLAFCDSAEGMEKLARAEADAIISYYTGHTHTYGEPTADRVGNCCLESITSRKCTVCGHRTDVVRGALDEDNHGWTTASRSVTCTTDGYVKRECQVSRNLNEKGLDHVAIHTDTTTYAAVGHTVVTEKDTAASHGVDGYKREVCTTCGAVWETVTPGDPHVYEETEAVPATCEEAGHTTYVCTVCDYTYTETFDPLGHEYITDEAPISCASDGEALYVCTVCNASYTETYEVPDHSYELTDKLAPTCEEAGTERYVCSVCGDVRENEIAPTGHAFGEGEVARDAGPLSDGERVFVCGNDASHVKVEVIPKTAGDLPLIIAAVAVIVLLLCGAAFILIRGGRRRIRESSDEAAAILEAGGTVVAGAVEDPASADSDVAEQEMIPERTPEN